MATELPEDILHLICDELRVRKDLSTLFNCAVSSKRLAPLALAGLYRAGRGSTGEDEEPQNRFINEQKLCIYWRSVTLASLGKTLYPYHAYLRSLNFGDLGHLLDDLRTYHNIEKVFFAGDLARFRHLTKPVKGAPKGRLDITKIVDDLGATIASRSSMIEDISGRISPRALQEWIPRLSRLQRLQLDDGSTLGDQDVQQAIYKHCPFFCELSIYLWMGADADEQLGKFLTGLPEQSLRVFNTFSSCKVSTETCLALNRHSDSLKSLAFKIEPDTIPALSLLGGCTSLETFKLEASPQINILDSHKEVFDEFAVWLASCENLREVTLEKFNSAPAALTPLLLNDNVRLEKLTAQAFSHASQYRSYHGEGARTFHQALLNQSSSLQSLDISGHIVEGEEPGMQDADLMVDSICQLKKLTSLTILGIMDDAFGDYAVTRLLAPLEQLEDVSFAGYGVTDKLLETLSSLRNLKHVIVNAYSRFTASGLLDFINNLGPGNQGMSIAVDWPDIDYALSPEEIALVTSSIESKVNGLFEYTAPREPNAGYGDDSDAEYDGSD